MFKFSFSIWTETGIWHHSISKVPPSPAAPFANLVRFLGGRPTFARNSPIPVATPLSRTWWHSVTVVRALILRVCSPAPSFLFSNTARGRQVSNRWRTIFWLNFGWLRQSQVANSLRTRSSSRAAYRNIPLVDTIG